MRRNVWRRDTAAALRSVKSRFPKKQACVFSLFLCLPLSVGLSVSLLSGFRFFFVFRVPRLGVFFFVDSNQKNTSSL